jgi:starch synthase
LKRIDLKSMPNSAIPVLDILMITPEARPFAKTGGLADVAGALPQALARLGHHVTIVLPRYRGVDTAGLSSTPAQIPFGGQQYPVAFVESTKKGDSPLFSQKMGTAGSVTAVLVEAPDLYDRDGLYGNAAGDFGDNGFRFAVLSRAALEYARLRGKRPSVIHGHDWQAGLAAAYLKTVLADDPILGGVRSVFTIHNLAFHGLFPLDLVRWLGLPDTLTRPAGLEFYGRASALKSGIVFSDAITTVSPTYAKEITTPEFGFGFEGIVASRSADLSGILNGIDTDTWNPESDPYLSNHFSAADLKGKSKAKAELLRYVGFAPDKTMLARPAIGLVSRLTNQKGFDLIAEAAESLMALDATWIMLGSGDAGSERFWQDLAARYPSRVSARIGFDEKLAHLIEAGSDLFLMPSRYEPCGLNQMYSLRYGTLPIVRATGGLDDTVVDADAEPSRGTGFKFRDYTAEALTAAVERALAAYGNTRRWRTVQRRAMAEDHSWDVSAREYVKVYEGVPRAGAPGFIEDTDGIRKSADADRRKLRPDGRRRNPRTR